MNNLQKYQSAVNAYDDDMFIGYLVWYSVPKTAKVPYTELNRKIIQAFGAFDSPMPLPRMPKPSDVFKRACSKQGNPAWVTNLVSEDGNELTVRYMIRDAGSDSYGTYREIVKEVLDQNEHELSHTTLGKFTYIKATEGMTFTPYADATGDEVVVRLVENVKEYFADATMVRDNGIRYVILDAIKKAMRGYQARSSGGIYFVNSEFGGQLEAFSEVISEIGEDEGNRVEFHFLPLVDDERQRTQLREAFTADVKQRFREISKDVAKILKSNEKISSRKFNRLHDEFQDVKDLIGEQQAILHDSLDVADGAAKMLNVQFVKLMGQLKK